MYKTLSSVASGLTAIHSLFDVVPHVTQLHTSCAEPKEVAVPNRRAMTLEGVAYMYQVPLSMTHKTWFKISI